MDVTGGYVVSKDAPEEQREEARKRIEETLARIDQPVARQSRLIESSSVAGGIAKASREYDLVVIGAALEPFFRKMLFGEIPEKVARFSPTSVLVVKKYEGPVKSLVKRIMG
jgi:nucleotide-binding universal stress UspA family protein